MYVMPNSQKLFADEIPEWLLEAGFIKCQCHMSIYLRYASDGTIVFSYLFLMTVSIGILLKLLETGLWII